MWFQVTQCYQSVLPVKRKCFNSKVSAQSRRKKQLSKLKNYRNTKLMKKQSSDIIRIVPIYLLKSTTSLIKPFKGPLIQTKCTKFIFYTIIIIYSAFLLL